MRTGILKNLLNRRNLRIVFFTKTKEKAEYYKNEFNDPRIIYEVHETPPPKGLDLFLSRLKFTLLKTATTDLKRRFIFEENKNHVTHYFHLLINWAMARPLLRWLARILDYSLVRNDPYREYFDKYKPDLVFLAHLFDESEIDLLRGAKRRKIMTIGFINSWDKVTARSALRLLPDKFIVFNNIVKYEIMKHDEVAEKNIFVSGVPHYDYYFGSQYFPREVFFRKINMSPMKKLVVYASAGRAQSNADLDMIDLLWRLNQEGKFGEGIGFLIRFQPNDFIDPKELKPRPDFFYDYPGIRFSSKRGVDWDMNFHDLDRLKDTLHHASLLISYTSSMCIDAAIFDKPVINVNFEIHPDAPAHKLPTRYFKVAHYQNVLRTGGVRLVNNEAELIQWVRRYLGDPALDREGRKRLVEEQCRYTDGKSGERIADFILNND